MKDNDIMDLSFEIKVFIHDVYATSVKIDITLTTFIKALYPTYFHHVESIQDSGQFKSLEFESLEENIVEHLIRTHLIPMERFCDFLKM
jgi:hypothetical protein